jgi:SAM-dependent methyltransferase
LARYDRIGLTYTETRRADPTIEAAVWAALGEATSVVNVGAGTGSYEPRDRDVIAVEPSPTMIESRPPEAAPAVQGSAEALPLADDAADAALAVFTLHHWSDVRRGLAELRRVARQRIVMLTWDKSFAGTFWLTRDYLPELEEWTIDRLPSIEEIEADLGCRVERRPLPIPHACRDGFLRAYWGRPEAYLEESVRRNISQFNVIDSASVRRGVDRLRADLSTGVWDSRHGHLRRLDSIDLGYVILVCDV